MNNEDVRRGLVTEKHTIRDLIAQRDLYAVTVQCEDEGEETFAVSKELYNQTIIAGLGRDTILEYGDGVQARIVSPDVRARERWVERCICGIAFELCTGDEVHEAPIRHQLEEHTEDCMGHFTSVFVSVERGTCQRCGRLVSQPQVRIPA